MSVLSLYLSLRDNRLLTLFTHVIPYRVPENYYFQISNGTRLFILTIAVIILQILSHSLSVCLVRLRDLSCPLHGEALSL